MMFWQKIVYNPAIKLKTIATKNESKEGSSDPDLYSSKIISVCNEGKWLYIIGKNDTEIKN